jgi:hypothetical protein
VAWAAVILTLGTSLFSIVRTSATLDPWLTRFAPGISANGLYNLQVFVRRSAHFTEYAILFLFLNFGPLRGRPVIAFIVCVGCASLDEASGRRAAAQSSMWRSIRAVGPRCW